MYQTGAKGIELIKHYEQCRLSAYKDSKGVPTIGWGNTFYEDSTKVKMGDKITQERADELFKNILKGFEEEINYLVAGVILKQYQFDALMSFIYWAGVENFETSTLLKKMYADPNDKTIPYEFSRWVYSGGKKLRGLVNRRKSESLLFSTGTLEFFY